MSKKGIVIAMYNRKGGCGKTTTTFQLAGTLANDYGKNVLIVGADPQAGISTNFFSDAPGIKEKGTLTDALIGDRLVEECISTSIKHKKYTYHYTSKSVFYRTPTKEFYTIDILPCDDTLEGLGVDSENRDELYTFKECIEPIRNKYDFIIIDMPPARNDLNIVFFSVADYILSPITDRESISGYISITKLVNDIRLTHVNDNLEILGAFLNRVNNVRSYSKMFLTEFHGVGEQFMQSYISDRSEIASNEISSTPLVSSSRKCAAMAEYHALAEEILKRIQDKDGE